MFSADLDRLIIERRLRHLTDLILNLPRASRTMESIQLDPDLAAALLASQTSSTGTDPDDPFAEEKPSWHPPGREWDLHAEQLGQVVQGLAELKQVVLGIVGAAQQRPDPYPSPRTALPDARREAIAHERDTLMRGLGFIQDTDTATDATEG